MKPKIGDCYVHRNNDRFLIRIKDITESSIEITINSGLNGEVVLRYMSLENGTYILRSFYNLLIEDEHK